MLKRLQGLEMNLEIQELKDQTDVFLKKAAHDYAPSYVDTMSVFSNIQEKSEIQFNLQIERPIEPLLLMKKDFEEAVVNLIKFIDIYGNKQGDVVLQAEEKNDNIFIKLTKGRNESSTFEKDLYELAEDEAFPELNTLDVLFTHKTLKNHKAEIFVYILDNHLQEIEVILSKHKLKLLAETLLENTLSN
jgi:hypothetical protein